MSEIAQVDISAQLILPNSKDGINKAAKLIQDGGLVAFPTETVYGLGANALNEEAVLNIFRAKGRPLTDPVIIHVSSASMAAELLDIEDDDSRQMFNLLTSCFWPGPLTIISKARSFVPLVVSAGTGFIGVRCPSHPLAIALIIASGLPIAAPSANRFGHVSPTKAHHVLADLGDKGINVLYGDDDEFSRFTCEHGIESTVVKLDVVTKKNSIGVIEVFDRRLCILRQGAVTQIQIENSLKEYHAMLQSPWLVQSIERSVVMHNTLEHPITIQNPSQSLLPSIQVEGQEAPGQAITHYAPDVPCIIVSGFVNDKDNKNLGNEIVNHFDSTDESILQLQYSDLIKSTVIIDFNGQLKSLQDRALSYRDLSISGNTSEAARNLFEYLRWSENVQGAAKVLLPCVSTIKKSDSPSNNNPLHSQDSDIVLGLTDRIYRAASGRSCTLQLIE